ncbi:MAG TPA: DoxX family protein [Thermoanaerobaculia bacterium]
MSADQIMDLNVTFPSSLALGDFALFVLRLVVALVFGASGYYHLTDPVGRAKSVELTPNATRALGAAEALGSLGLVSGILVQPAALGLMVVGLGAIQKKAFQWKTGIWGKGTDGWHYDLMLLAMNLVIVATAGGRWVLHVGERS